MPFPSVLSSFNQPTATSRLNNPSHSALHNTVSSAVGQIEAVIGLADSSSTLGTIIGDLRSPGSSGGGHVQTANKGGTGQTAYTKGDILVATSSSVLTKLAIGADNTVLVANSSVAGGMNWIGKGIIGQSAVNSVAGLGVVTEQSIMSVTIPANTLSTNKAIRATVYVKDLSANNSSVLLKANYGTTAISSILFPVAGDNFSGNIGKIELTVLAKGATNLQQGTMLVDIRRSNLDGSATPSVRGIFVMPIGSVAIDSTQAQTLGMTVMSSTTSPGMGLSYAGYLVEGIT